MLIQEQLSIFSKRLFVSKEILKFFQSSTFKEFQAEGLFRVSESSFETIETNFLGKSPPCGKKW